jgi:hypothetical protein
MSEENDDKAHRDAYAREYYGRKWFWRNMSLVTVLPVMLFCGAIVPETNPGNFLVLVVFLVALVNVFWLVDLRRVTKKYFPPKT